MNDFEQVEILLAEDSDADAEMTIRALRRNNLANRLVRVKDGAEALDFIFRRGAYASRPVGAPKLVPCEAASQTAFTMSGCAWPARSGPQLRT